MSGRLQCQVTHLTVPGAGEKQMRRGFDDDALGPVRVRLIYPRIGATLAQIPHALVDVVQANGILSATSCKDDELRSIICSTSSDTLVTLANVRLSQSPNPALSFARNLLELEAKVDPTSNYVNHRC